VLGVVIGHTASETIHKDGNGRDVHATEGADDSGLRHTSSKVTSQEGGFIGLECLGKHIRDSRAVSIVNDGEFQVRIGFSSSLGGITQQEADGDDQITFSSMKALRFFS